MIDLENMSYVTTIDSTLSDIVQWMAGHCDNFMVDYDDRRGEWECSWTVDDGYGGRTYTAVSEMSMPDAMQKCLKQAGYTLLPAKHGNPLLMYIDIYRKKDSK